MLLLARLRHWLTAAMVCFICIVGVLAAGHTRITVDLGAPNPSLFPSETTPDGRMFRWGGVVVDIPLPWMPAGFVVIRQTSLAIVPQTMTVRIGDDGLATAALGVDDFRTYQHLVFIPAHIWPVQSLRLYAPSAQPIDGRTLGTAIQQISLTPTSMLAMPNLWYVGWTLVVIAGGWIALRRAAVIEMVISGGVCIAALAISGQWGSLHWALGIATLWSMLTVGVSTLRPWIRQHWRRFVAQPVTFAAILSPSVHTYRADIDGLRALAVGAVVCYHAFPEWFPGGFVGVDVFFVISGFLITNIFLTQLQNGTFHIGDFYERRIRRIFPALFVVLLGTLVIGWVVLLPNELMRLGWHIASGVGFVANIAIFREVGYFAESALHTPLLHLWSLGIEEQFYLVWPLFLWWWARQPRFHWLILLGPLALSLVASVVFVFIDRDAAFFLIPTRFWQLASGGALAVWQRTTVSPRTLPEVASIVGVGGIVGATWWYHESLPFPGALALVPTVATILIIAANHESWLNRQIFSHRVVVFVGLISYPLYLWHWPLLSYGYLLFESQFTLQWRAVVVGMSVVLAIITYYAVEHPLRFGRWRHVSVHVLTVSMLVLGSVALMGIASGRIPARQSPHTAGTPTATLPVVACTKVFAGASINTNNDSLCLQVPARDTTTPEYIIIGDSHSGALAIGFAQRDAGYPMRSYMLPGCLPGLNIERYDNKQSGSYDCSNPGNYAAVLAHLHTEPALRPRIIVVVGRFTSIASTALNPNNHERISVQDAGPRHDLTMAERTTVVSAGIHDLIAPLSQLPNTRVIVVRQVPEFDFTPNNCMRLASLTGDNTFCRTPRARIQAHAQSGDALINQALAGLEHVTLYDPWPLWCDRTSCSPIDDQQQLVYRDSHHLNDVGGIRMAKQLIQQLTPRK
jgi:peptidoglycan/LPS O-acetylase OafA/YrhL